MHSDSQIAKIGYHQNFKPFPGVEKVIKNQFLKSFEIYEKSGTRKWWVEVSRPHVVISDTVYCPVGSRPPVCRISVNPTILPNPDMESLKTLQGPNSLLSTENAFNIRRSC